MELDAVTKVVHSRIATALFRVATEALSATAVGSFVAVAVSS